jgi:maltooligosyltrehalose synthase
MEGEYVMNSETSRFKYEFLNRVRITLHADQRSQLSKQTLNEIDEYIDFEFYNQEKIKQISGEDLIQAELNRLIQLLLKIRNDRPDGSNQECLCMEQITEFISKLDMVDFRKLKIQRLS